MITRIALSSTTCHKAAVFSLLLMAMAPVVFAEAQDEKTAVTRTLKEYVAAFGTLDTQRVLPYYDEPLMLVTAARTLVLATRADVDAWLKSLYQRLKERGWEGRNEYTQLHVRQLGADLAEANALYVRYKPDGQELDRIGVIYVLRKTSGGWKVAVLVSHDPGAVRSLD